MKDITIREVQVKDAPRVLKAFKDIARDSRWILTEPDEVVKTVKREKEFIRKYLKSKNSMLALAETGGQVVGLVGAEGGKMRRAKHLAIVGIVVVKPWRGKGVGKAMMKYLIRWARGAGITKLRLDVVDQNRVARDMYRKLGFKKEGLLKRDIKIGRRYYNIVVMSKLLNPSKTE